MPVGETIAVMASIIAIIQISDRIIDLCKFYMQAASDTPSDLRVILVEISTLKSVLESVQFLETCNHAMPALWKQLSGSDGPIEECRRTMADLEKLFPADQIPVTANRSRSKKRKVQLALTSLAWPLKARRARELLQNIIQQKTTINLALTTESTQDIKSIKKDTEEIRTLLTETQRYEVYRWLQVTDPSPIHNRAWKQHEPETSKWMLRLPEWTKWLSGDARCLWIHGIPGAGKTILASFLVEQIKEHCKERKQSGHASYYCYFGRNQEEAAPFLRWVIAQLCRQAEVVPKLVYNLYKQGGQPSLAELLLALEEVLQSFDITYLILDAADESKPRQDLLKVLRDLATDARFSKIHCLITSREYIDIEETLQPISCSIPMSNALIEDDIRKYVQAILVSSSKFQQWTTGLLDEVENAVVNGSKGMFRWAVCQLYRLQRLKCERQIIMNALRTLPKTLDETYERIFLDISRDEWPFVHHALQWICFHQDLYQDHHPMSIKILLTATETSTCRENLQENDLDYGSERLRNMLGCLVNVDENDRVFLAHYTVKEYLESQRISKSATSYFRVGKEEMIKEYLPIVLQKAQYLDWSDDKDELLNRYNLDTPVPFLEDFAVYCAATSSMSLFMWHEAIASEKSLFSLAVDFVNPALDKFVDIDLVCWSFQNNCCFFSDQFTYPNTEYFMLSWIERPKNNDAQILLHLLLTPGKPSNPVLAKTFLQGKDVVGLAQCRMAFQMDVLDELPRHGGGNLLFEGSLLQIMAQLSDTYPESFQLLLNHFHAEMNSELLVCFTSCHYYHHPDASYDGGCKDSCIISRILDGQADPNATGYYVTPLQIAVANWDVEGVRALLAAGAEPNASGDRNGIPFKTKSFLERFNDLHGWSPLFICRNREPPDELGFSIRERDEIRNSIIPQIDALLLEHNARESSSLG